MTLSQRRFRSTYRSQSDKCVTDDDVDDDERKSISLSGAVLVCILYATNSCQSSLHCHISAARCRRIVNVEALRY